MFSLFLDRSKEELIKLKEFKAQHQVALKHHDFFLEKRGPLDKNSRTFPVPFDEKLRKKKKYKKALKEKRVEKLLNLAPLFDIGVEFEQARDNFFVLCKDGAIPSRDPILDSKLFCRYQDHADPYLRLGPFKLEEANADPFIVVFHEIIFDEEINQLKARAAPDLRRSVTGGMNDQKTSKS